MNIACLNFSLKVMGPLFGKPLQLYSIRYGLNSYLPFENNLGIPELQVINVLYQSLLSLFVPFLIKSLQSLVGNTRLTLSVCLPVHFFVRLSVLLFTLYCMGHKCLHTCLICIIHVFQASSPLICRPFTQPLLTRNLKADSQLSSETLSFTKNGNR